MIAVSKPTDFYEFIMSRITIRPSLPPLVPLVNDTDPLVLKDHFTEDDLDFLGIEHPRRHVDPDSEPFNLFDD